MVTASENNSSGKGKVFDKKVAKERGRKLPDVFGKKKTPRAGVTLLVKGGTPRPVRRHKKRTPEEERLVRGTWKGHSLRGDGPQWRTTEGGGLRARNGRV